MNLALLPETSNPGWLDDGQRPPQKIDLGRPQEFDNAPTQRLDPCGGHSHDDEPGSPYRRGPLGISEATHVESDEQAFRRFRVSEHCIVVLPLESLITHVDRVEAGVTQPPYQRTRQVLVDEDLHSSAARGSALGLTASESRGVLQRRENIGTRQLGVLGKQCRDRLPGREEVENDVNGHTRAADDRLATTDSRVGRNALLRHARSIACDECSRSAWSVISSRP